MAEKYEISILFKMVDELTGGTGKVGEALARLQGKVSALGHSLTSMGKDLSLKLTAPLMLLGGLAVKEAAEQEVFAASLEKVAGSAKAAWDMVERLEEFASKTPFEMPGIVATTKRLLIMGVTQDELMGKMGMLSDIAVGSGMSFDELALHYGKVVERGKATSRELVGMSAMGIPIMDMIQKQFHLTEEQLMEAAGKGKISSAIFLKALERLTKEGGVYAGETARRAKTLAGTFHRLKVNTFRALQDIGNKLIEVFDLKGVLTSMLAWVEKAKAAFERFAETSPKLMKFVFILTAIAVALGPILVGLGVFITAIGVIAGVSGLGLVIVALVGVAAGIAALVIYWDEVIAAVDYLAAANQRLYDAMQKLTLENLIESVKEALNWIGKLLAKITFTNPGGAYSNTLPEGALPSGASSFMSRNPGGYGSNPEATVNIKVSADPGTTATVEDSHGRGGARVKVDTIGYVGWGDLVR